MSYQTLEVELDHGLVRPVGTEALPLNAKALLTILKPVSVVSRVPEPPVGVSLADMVRDLAGIGRGEHTDLSTNKAQFDDFGR